MFKCKKRAGIIAASQIQTNWQAYCKNEADLWSFGIDIPVCPGFHMSGYDSYGENPMTETQKEHAISQIVAHGLVFFVAMSNNEFRRRYTKSWKNLLVAHGVAAILTWLLYCAWQENRPSAA